MIVYACTTNGGKLRTFRQAREQFGAGHIAIEPLPELGALAVPPEDESTFEGNAILKAQYYSATTSALIFADDSGLSVASLEGAPGVRSARYAGEGASDEANNRLLLTNLLGFTDRRAEFVCVIALAREGKIQSTFHGSVSGEVLTEARGDYGFGYDPLFFYSPLARTFGELTESERFAVSARGNALRLLFAYLNENDSVR